ncbi:MAG: GNAT family N-acetyltransferase [Caulobacter sp.]|nr:GNAT family N-acetyltransferase [Caulobacter sp.]
MQIDIVRPDELTAAQIDHWAGLQGADPRLHSPFLSPCWARSVAQAQGDRANVKVAMLHEGGQPRGYMAARAGLLTAMPVGAPMCDYQGLVAEPGVPFDPVKMVQALGVGRFDFCHMLEGQSGFEAHLKGAQPSFAIDVSEGYEAYAQARRATGVTALKDTDKKRRKLEREAGTPVFAAFSRSRADFDQLIAWKRAQWKATGQTDVLAAGWTSRLVRDLFQSRDPDFGGVLFTLHVGEKLAAAQFNLRAHGAINSWLIGHDPAFERWSPGMILFQDILRWMDASPYWRLDLGAGDYRFKRELANVVTPVAHGFVGDASPAALMRGAAYALRQAAESLPLGPVSALPGKAMRRLDLIRGLR